MNKYLLIIVLIVLILVFLYVKYGIRERADDIHAQINQYIDNKQSRIQLKVYDVDEKKTKTFIVEEDDSNDTIENFSSKKSKHKSKKKSKKNIFKQHVKKPFIETFSNRAKIERDESIKNDTILEHYSSNYDTYSSQKPKKDNIFKPYNLEDSGYFNQEIKSN